MSEQLTSQKKEKGLKGFFQIADKYQTNDWLLAFPLLIFSMMPMFMCILSLNASVPSSRMEIGYNTYIVCTICGVAAILFNILRFFAYNGSVRQLVSENRSWLLFMAIVPLMLLSTAVNGITIPQIWWAFGVYPTEEMLLMYVSFFMIFFACASMISSREIKTFVIRLIEAIALTIAILTLFDHFGIPVASMREFSEDHLEGVFFQFNHYGYYLTVGLGIGAGMFVWEEDKFWRYFGLFSFMVHCFTLILNDTFGCILASLLVLVFLPVIYSIVNKRFSFKALSPLLIYIVMMFIMSFWVSTVLNNFIVFFGDIHNIAENNENAGRAGTTRWALWTSSIEYIKERPLLGFGIEGTSLRLRHDAGSTHPHNEYLQYASYFGVPAALLYIAGIISVYIRGLKNRSKLRAPELIAYVTAFGYFVSACFGNPRFYTAPFLFIVFGLAYNTGAAKEEPQEQNDSLNDNNISQEPSIT